MLWVHPSAGRPQSVLFAQVRQAARMVGLILPDPATLRIPSHHQQVVPGPPQALLTAGRRPSPLSGRERTVMSEPQTSGRAQRARGASLRVHALSDGPTEIAEGGFPRSAKVGVLGGGQLGKMLAIEAVCPPPFRFPGPNFVS